MTWPINPTDISEIPHNDWDNPRIAGMSPIAAQSLLDTMPLISDSLELVTLEDLRLERVLGGVLLKLAEEVNFNATYMRI
jgi:hypothetical protein